MTRLINDTAKLWKMPESFEARAKLGADPITALLPHAGCSLQERYITVAIGLVSGCLKKSNRGYELNGQSNDTVYLGTDLRQITDNVGDNYPWLVSLYRSFVKKLAAQPEEVISLLDRHIYEGTSNNGDLSAQLGKEPFVKTRQIADALMPYIRRMPSNNIRKAEKEGD
jgi:hypothetical protein